MHEVVVHAGEVGETMHVVLDGEVAVLSPYDARELLRLGAGDFFGEMSLLTGAARAATVVTTRPTRTFVVDQAQLQEIVQRFPEVADALGETLGARQADLTSLLEQRPTDSQRSRQLKSLIMERIKGIFRFGGR
jgi:CRP-like cAMP-binding protein